jgi:D-amino-acid dehydrogenase
MFESIQEFFPKFTPDLFANLPVWEGLRPCSPDGLPYIGKSRLRENLYVATGHSMMGMSLAPITGKIIANSLTQKEQPMDIEPFSTDRFHR